MAGFSAGKGRRDRDLVGIGSMLAHCQRRRPSQTRRYPWLGCFASQLLDGLGVTLARSAPQKAAAYCRGDDCHMSVRLPYVDAIADAHRRCGRRRPTSNVVIVTAAAKFEVRLPGRAPTVDRRSSHRVKNCFCGPPQSRVIVD
jgi:hypothetical protein